MTLGSSLLMDLSLALGLELTVLDLAAALVVLDLTFSLDGDFRDEVVNYFCETTCLVGIKDSDCLKFSKCAFNCCVI
jgi:hypothetical protein